MKKITYLLLLFLIVGSCTSLSKDECQQMSWSSKGKEDAYSGLSVQAFAKYTKQCREHGVSISKNKYIEGFNLGLKSFCTPERAENFGKQGGIYKGQCPAKVEESFLKSYNLGYRAYKLDQREKELKEREARLEGDSAAQTLAMLGGKKSCSFDSDCVVEDECTLSRCEVSGRRCSFDSDCEQQGDCRFSQCRYTLQNSQCSFDSDCTLENECRFSRCENTGMKCSFDSDCEVQGDCRANRCQY